MEVSGQLHAPDAITPGERAPCTHGIGSWVGPRRCGEEKKNPSPCRESNSYRPAYSTVRYL